ncbi:MAG: BACON domain-containing protein [Odoribacter splanchnicus]
MKKNVNLAVIFFSLLMLFSACSEKDDEEVKAFLEVSPASLDFPATGATRSVTVTSNVLDWSYSCDVDWCKIERREKQLEITVGPYNELELRTAKIVVKATGLTDQIINVRQSAAAEASLVITPEVLGEFAANAPATQTLTVETNQSKVIISKAAASWCEVLISDDYTTITVRPQINTELQERTTNFTVQAGEESNKKELTFEVKQSAAKLVDVDKIELNETGYRIIVPVYAEVESYSAAAHDDWCTVKTTDEGLLICAPAYTEEGGERKTTVSITMNEEVKATIAVTQIGGVLELHDEYWYNGQLVGVVALVSHPYDWIGIPDYTQIWVMALEEKREVQWCVDPAVNIGVEGTQTSEDVWRKIKEQPDWQNRFPAYAYCAEMSKKTGMANWTLGFIYEMYYAFRDENHNDQRGKDLNKRIEELGGTPLNGSYWGDMEVPDFTTEAGYQTIMGYYVNSTGGGKVDQWFGKDEIENARCIWRGAFDTTSPTEK